MTAPAKSDIEKYVEHLEYHDWYFNYSDDHRVWSAGNDAQHVLRAEQKRLDPDFYLWNQHAPEEFRVPISKDKNL